MSWSRMTNNSNVKSKISEMGMGQFPGHKTVSPSKDFFSDIIEMEIFNFCLWLNI